MKTRKNSVFIFTVCVVYLISVVLFSFALLKEYKLGADRAENRFNSLTRDISRIGHTYTPRSSQFYDEVLRSIGNISDIAGLQLKYGQELILSYPTNLGETANTNSSLLSSFSTNINTDNGIPITLTASIYMLKPYSIYRYGKLAFFVILVATLSAIFYLVLFVRNGTFPTERAYESDSSEDENFQYPDVESYESFEEEKIEDTAEQEKSAEGEQEAVPQKSEEELIKEEADEILNKKNKAETPEAANESQEQQIIEENEEEEDILAFLNEKEPASETNSSSANESHKEEANEPKGLFCPETSFGWEEYMMPRLDSELVRSASSDQDLSLFIIKINGIEWTEPYGKQISKLILETVKFNDLVFNNEEYGATAIFQNQNTDQALVTAEKLYKKICEILSDNGMTSNVAIGISTRSLRLISGSRLLNEAVEALHHAEEDEESPIVAFRVNPDKYKDFLASASYQPEIPHSQPSKGAILDEKEEELADNETDEKARETADETLVPASSETVDVSEDIFENTKKEFEQEEKSGTSSPKFEDVTLSFNDF